MKPMNIEALERLIQMYKNLTLEQLEQEWNETISYNAVKIMMRLTGFSRSDTCILCTSVAGNCELCVHSVIGDKDIPCVESTYDNMHYAKSPQALYDAVQDRIKHLEHIRELIS